MADAAAADATFEEVETLFKGCVVSFFDFDVPETEMTRSLAFTREVSDRASSGTARDFPPIVNVPIYASRCQDSIAKPKHYVKTENALVVDQWWFVTSRPYTRLASQKLVEPQENATAYSKVRMT